MRRSVDDRTQVQVVTLRTEAQLLKTWMARREGAAQRRRDGPIDALKHRLALLQKETPRLELETATLEKELGRASQPIGAGALIGGVVRGALLVAAAALWVAGVVTLTPDARADDPLRLAAMLSIVVLVALGRVTSKAT
ncbi:MAG: hypothetical protein U0228_11395 [Myxococcaceae bacterium]